MADNKEVHHITDKSSSADEPRGSDWFGKLYDLFAPVRQYVLESGMTDEEVNQIIDEALKEVREEQRLKQQR